VVVSGQKKVATAGTAVQVSTNTAVRKYILRALPGNTGNIAIGNDGNDDVTMSNGLVLKPEDPPMKFCGRLSEMWMDAANNGDGISWMVIDVE